MEKFATILLAARQKRGMTQAQVAAAAGLTPSYLSFIENQKKPPPSDDVCERLAEVLHVSAEQLIEVAHLERASKRVQRRMQSLRHSLKRERRSRRRVLEALLSPFLFRGPPGYFESALGAMAISAARKRRLREALAAVGRHKQDRADEVARIVEDLSERERNVLLESLPELLGDTPARASPSPPPEIHYAPSDKAGEASKPYLLEAPVHAVEYFSEMDAGDLLLVQPDLSPEAGDFLVLRGAEGPLIRRLVTEGRLFRLDDGIPVSPGEAVAQSLTRAELEIRLRAVGAGTVIEVRRPLRRRGR